MNYDGAVEICSTKMEIEGIPKCRIYIFRLFTNHVRQLFQISVFVDCTNTQRLMFAILTLFATLLMPKTNLLLPVSYTHLTLPTIYSV